jgi:hypothetical protein
MARIRSIKPEIIEDEKTAPLSDAAFRLFTSMIFLADDHGNVRADARWLQAQIWWAHREPPRVAAILREIYDAHLIQVYGVRGGVYAHLLGWEKHQRIDNAGKPRVPLPSDPEAIMFSPDMEPAAAPSRILAASRGEIPLDPDPDRDPDPEKEEEGEAAAAAAPLHALKRKVDKATRKVALSADWKPRDEERARAQESGLNCDEQAAQFRDYHAAKGSRMVDWDAAFRTWLRNGARFASERANGGRGGPRQGSLNVGRSEPHQPHEYPTGEVPLD